jgi:glycerol-3-phosphate cytidylyltransferase
MKILTCGVFDLLHIGHINFLKKLKKENGKLIVLIHSDRFVCSYKRKPIINEIDRLELIKNVKFIDQAFINDEDYISDDIITKYNIDKIYHGIDIENKNIWDYYYHIPININIMNYIPYDNNYISTTQIINKIINNNNNNNNYEDRYTKKNILDSEILYGKGLQSPASYNILNEIIPNNKYKKILEIGCGLGGNCNYLSNKYINSDIIGIDISKNMIDICNERNTNSKIKYIESDYKDLILINKFNLIFCRDVCIYLYTEQKYKFLKKVRSELEDNGIFVLIDYCVGNIINNDFTNYYMNRKWNIISVPFYKKLLNDTGFTLIDDGDLTNNYIDYFKILNKDIPDNIIDNLNKKLLFLKNRNFEWHYFVLKKDN